MSRLPVVIAGGGIGGLAMALTLHQIGVPCLVIEQVASLKPLGVGVNLQPNAVRELIDLGFTTDDLDAIGLAAREWALVGLNGKDVYSERRGLEAGYNWPQYAVHRGRLQMMLDDAVTTRLGPDAVQLGSHVNGYANNSDGTVSVFVDGPDGDRRAVTGSMLVGADGLHSAVRAQMHPDQPPIHWGGAIMWRGVSKGVPIRSGASFVGLGTNRQRVVFYPISPPDPTTGLADINWIAEVTVDAADGWTQSGWFKPVAIDDFIHHFDGWSWDWIDLPALFRRADGAYENPMIDRDPVPTWQDGKVVLIGDAAHPMYPTGSNGASQAIVDARVLGAMLLEHGVTSEAIAAFDQRMCGPISNVVLRNRGAGPFGLLDLLDQRCGNQFDDIDDVIPAAERSAFMAGYKAAAGFAIETLNAAPATIAPGVRVDAPGEGPDDRPAGR